MCSASVSLGGCAWFVPSAECDLTDQSHMCHYGCSFVPLAVPWLSCLLGWAVLTGLVPPALCCSACAEASGLPQGDLEVMEAAVLQQLQAVSQRAQSRSLPPENPGEAVSRAGYEEHIRYRGTQPTGVRNIFVSALDLCCPSGTEAARSALANGAVGAWSLVALAVGAFRSSFISLPFPSGGPCSTGAGPGFPSSFDPQCLPLWQAGNCRNSKHLSASHSQDLKVRTTNVILRRKLFCLRQKMHVAFENNKVQLFKMSFFFPHAYATRTSDNYFFFRSL